MRIICLVLSLALVAITAAGAANLSASPEFQDIVNYLNSRMSSDEIIEMLKFLPEALGNDDEDPEVMQRSILTMIGNVVHPIPWNKIGDSVNNMAKKNPEFSKVLDLINDSKFRELVKSSVNSHTLKEFVKDVAEHGFSWTEFLHLLLHALCSAANILLHDSYIESVCQVLQNL